MSYDVAIGDVDLNYTSNVSNMWDAAMPDLNLRDMGGKTGAECLPHLRAGVKYMAENRQFLQSMEPDNGWGNYGGALMVLVRLMFGCEESPDGEMSVCT